MIVVTLSPTNESKLCLDVASDVVSYAGENKGLSLHDVHLRIRANKMNHRKR